MLSTIWKSTFCDLTYFNHQNSYMRHIECWENLNFVGSQCLDGKIAILPSFWNFWLNQILMKKDVNFKLDSSNAGQIMMKIGLVWIECTHFWGSADKDK